MSRECWRSGKLSRATRRSGEHRDELDHFRRRRRVTRKVPNPAICRMPVLRSLVFMATNAAVVAMFALATVQPIASRIATAICSFDTLIGPPIRHLSQRPRYRDQALHSPPEVKRREGATIL